MPHGNNLSGCHRCFSHLPWPWAPSVALDDLYYDDPSWGNKRISPKGPSLTVPLLCSPTLFSKALSLSGFSGIHTVIPGNGSGGEGCGCLSSFAKWKLRLRKEGNGLFGVSLISVTGLWLKTKYSDLWTKDLNGGLYHWICFNFIKLET